MHGSWMLFHEENRCNYWIPGCASSQRRPRYPDREMVHFESSSHECKYVHVGDAHRACSRFLSSIPQYELGAVKTGGPCISVNLMRDDREKEFW